MKKTLSLIFLSVFVINGFCQSNISNHETANLDLHKGLKTSQSSNVNLLSDMKKSTDDKTLLLSANTNLSALETNTYDSRFSVFLNNEADLLHIQGDIDEKYLVNIYSLNKDLVYTGKFKYKNSMIDVSSLVSGYYNIDIQCGEYCFTNKVLIK